MRIFGLNILRDDDLDKKVATRAAEIDFGKIEMDFTGGFSLMSEKSMLLTMVAKLLIGLVENFGGKNFFAFEITDFKSMDSYKITIRKPGSKPLETLIAEANKRIKELEAELNHNELVNKKETRNG